MSWFVGNNWKRLVPNAANLTDSELDDIANTPAGRRALEADRQEAIKAANAATSLNLRDAETGEVLTRFSSHEQRQRAYGNPLYRTSQAFRDAVASAEANTIAFDEKEATAGNLRGGPKGVDANSMLEAARHDAARAHVAKLFKAANGDTPDAAIARVQIMELMTSTDPAIQQMVAYATEVHHGEDRPIERELKANKATGAATRIQHGPEGVTTVDGVLHEWNPRDIDYSTGLYADGSAPPSGNDNTNNF